MYYHILIFTIIFQQLLRISSDSYTIIQTIQFKWAGMEHYKIPFIIRWKLHTAGTLQLERGNGTFIMQGDI